MCNQNQSAQRGTDRGDPESRRGNDLTKMIETLDPSFDKFSIFQYGCNCQFLMSGDRPMSHPGYGRPVDALDRICKEYRSCVKCLKDQHGEACIPEVTKYRWKVTNGEITSTNRPGSCERDTFECDLRLAVKLAQKDYTLNDKLVLLL